MFRNVRYAEFRPPVILQAPAPASGEGAASVTLHARQQYNLTCVGHKAVTWHGPGRADTGLARERSRCGTLALLKMKENKEIFYPHQCNNHQLITTNRSQDQKHHSLHCRGACVMCM